MMIFPPGAMVIYLTVFIWAVFSDNKYSLMAVMTTSRGSATVIYFSINPSVYVVGLSIVNAGSTVVSGVMV